MPTTASIIHNADECAASLDGGGCRPWFGEWLQPSRYGVASATDELGDDAPWCQIQARAHELDDA